MNINLEQQPITNEEGTTATALDPIQVSPLQPDYENRPWSLIDILLLLVREKRRILLGSLPLAFLTTVIVFLLPNVYTAQATLMPPNQGPSSGTALLSQLGGGAAGLSSLTSAGLGIKNPVEMYVALFRTHKVEDAVIARYNLQKRYKKKLLSDTRKVLESKSSIELGTKDGLISLSVTDRDPVFAFTMANGYVEEFRRLFADLATSEAAQRRTFFDGQLRQAKDNLANAEIELKNTEQATGVLQIDSQARALIQEDATLRAQITAKEVQLQGMRSYATGQDPDVQVAQQQLSALKTQQQSLAGIGTGNSDLMLPKGRVPEAGMTYLRKLRDVKYYETIYESLARQLEIAKLDEARQGATIQIVDPATLPDKKSGPHRVLLILIAFVVSFLLMSIYVFLKENLSLLLRQPSHGAQFRNLHQALFGKN